nr:sugar ABC transporter permease [uncultured Acetatifactor sp.]
MKKRSKLIARRTMWAYLFMMPSLILVLIFTVYPIIASLVITLMNYSGGLGKTEFVGLGNFQKLFKDRVFWIAVKNSVTFVIIVPIIQILSILLALLLNRKVKGVGLFRTLYYIPVVTSAVATSIMWSFLMGPQGIINNVLLDLGLIDIPQGFFSMKRLAMPSVMFVTIWQGLGYYMMMYLAGLQSVSPEYQEAARIDGANGFQVFTKITFPLLKPYIWFCTLNSVIAAIGVFDVVFMLTEGGPNNATMVINYYGYTKAFKEFKFGYGAAINLCQAVVTTAVSILVFVYGKSGGGMTRNE